MEQGLARLREKGYKITPQRRAVLSALLDGGRFATAQQVLENVKKTQPDVSLDTIYRNLSLMEELGIVHEVHRHMGNVYEVIRQGEHHHHIVCTECGKTECLDICPVKEEYNVSAAKKGFIITGHIFEFYGICQNCQKTVKE